MSDKVYCDRCRGEIDVSGDPKWAVCDADAKACGRNWCGECRNKEKWDNVEERCPACAAASA